MNEFNSIPSNINSIFEKKLNDDLWEIYIGGLYNIEGIDNIPEIVFVSEKTYTLFYKLYN